jgi:hypothetical protein
VGGVSLNREIGGGPCQFPVISYRLSCYQLPVSSQGLVGGWQLAVGSLKS